MPKIDNLILKTMFSYK